MPLALSENGLIQGTVIVLTLKVGGLDDWFVVSSASSSCGVSTTICPSRSLMSFGVKVTRSRWRSTRSRSPVRQLLSRAAGAEMTAQRGYDEHVKLGCRNSAGRCRCRRFLLQHGLGDVDAARNP